MRPCLLQRAYPIRQAACGRPEQLSEISKLIGLRAQRGGGNRRRIGAPAASLPRIPAALRVHCDRLGGAFARRPCRTPGGNSVLAAAAIAVLARR